LNNTALKKRSFQTDRQLEYRFHRSIKAILGNQFIYQNEIEDLENGTDFLLLKATPFRIGVRLRRNKYLKHYYNEFTIRWTRPSGVETEIDKIRDGLVDYFMYGFVNKEQSKIIQYFIADLKIFCENEPSPLEIHENDPADSELAVYNINQFPKDFILKYWPNPNNH